MRNSVDMSYRRSGRSSLAAGARWRWRAVLFLVFAAMAVLVWFWSPLNDRALAGVSYSARIACSCHYIGGREMSDCRKDLPPGMSMVMLGVDADSKSVTARLLPVASQTAFYREGQGCMLERYGR